MKNQIRQFHTSDSKKSEPDYHGIGVRNPQGRSIEIMRIKETKSNKFGKPPLKLA